MADFKPLRSPLDRLATDLNEEARAIKRPEAAGIARSPDIRTPDTRQPRRQSKTSPSSWQTRPAELIAPEPITPIFEIASREHNVPVNVLMAIAHQESGYQPDAIGQPTEWGRAKGMMQYIDSTAEGMGINPLDPAQSVDAAARQYRERVDSGYSPQEAIKAHFAGDDRDLWGPKTNAYGSEVWEKADLIGKSLATKYRQQRQESPQKDEQPQSLDLSGTAALQQNLAEGRDETPTERPDAAELQRQARLYPSRGVGLDDKRIEQEGGVPEVNEPSYLERLGNSLETGYDQMTRSLNTTAYLMGGDVSTRALSEEISREWKERSEQPRSESQLRLDAAIEAVGEVEGFWNTVGATGRAIGTAVTEPEALSLGIAEQGANMLPSLLTGAAGAGGGAGIGAGVGGPAGATVGAGWGFIAGQGVGTTAVEVGAQAEQIMAERLQAAGKDPSADNIRMILEDPAFIEQAREEGVKKGLTISAVDALTMKLGGRIATAPGRAAERQAVETLAEAKGIGQDAARGLLMTKAGREALAAADPGLAKRLAAGGTAFAVEAGGEAAGEAAGQQVATGEVDGAEVAAEGIYGAGQSAVMTGVAAGFEAAAQRARRRRDANQAPEQQDTAQETPSEPQAETASDTADGRNVSDEEYERVWADAGVPGTDSDPMQTVDVQGQPAEAAQQQAEPQGERVVVRNRTGEIEGTIESFSQDGDNFTLRMLADDGVPYEFNQSDSVQIERPEQPAVREQAAPAPERGYEEMSEPELRERLRYLAGQAKESGWSKPLTQERRKVERAIDAITTRNRAEMEQAPAQPTSEQREPPEEAPQQPILSRNDVTPEPLANAAMEASSAVGRNLGTARAKQTVGDARRVAFQAKKDAYAAKGDLEKAAAMERELDGVDLSQPFPAITYDDKPRFGTSGGYDYRENAIHLTNNASEWAPAGDQSPERMTPERAIYHEVGHWGFMNALTGKERLAAAQAVKGDLKNELIPGKAGSDYPGTKFDDVDEYIAEMYSNYKRGIPTDERLTSTFERIDTRVASDTEASQAIQAAITEGEQLRRSEQTAPATTETAESDAETASTGEPIVTHTTRRRNRELRGVLRDVPLAEAKEIDPYAFRKDGQSFIRLERLEESQQATVSTEQAAPTEQTPTEAPAERVGKKDGTPFASEAVAKRAATNRWLSGYEPVQVDGGWMLQEATAEQSPSVSDDNQGGQAPEQRSAPSDVNEQYQAAVEKKITSEKARMMRLRREPQTEENQRKLAGSERRLRSLRQRVFDDAPEGWRPGDTISPKWGARSQSSTEEKPTRGTEKQQTSEQESTPRRPQIGDPDYSQVDAMNDLMEMRAELDAQGMVSDARLSDRMRRQEQLVREMEADNQPAESSQQSDSASMPSDQGPHYAAGWKSATEGKPRELPSYFTSSRNKNAKDWMRGWDAASQQAGSGVDRWKAQAEEALSRVPSNHPMRRKWAASVRNGLRSAGDRESVLSAMREAAETDGDSNTPNPQPTEGAEVDTKPQESQNTIFTEDAAEKARAVLRSKLNQLNSGIDPEIMQAGITLAGYHIEKGARSFGAYARAMVEDMGDGVKPYLKSWYMGVKYDPRAADFDGMSAAADVESADVDAVTAEDTTNDTASPTEDAGTDDEGSGADRVPEDQATRGAADDTAAPRQRDGEQQSRRQGRRRGRDADTDQPGVSERPDGSNTTPERSLQSSRKTSPRSSRRADQGNGDYRIQPGEIARTGSWRDAAERNVEIVELVKRLESEGRAATSEEKALLTKYTGWGASEIANNIFPDAQGRYKTDKWKALGEQLKAALTDAEYAQARRTTQYAHYTSEAVITSIYDGLDRMGFKGGSVLEPGMGIGLFKGLMPQDMTGTYTGIEYDGITAQIAERLYPQSNVIAGDYAQTKLPKDFFDAAIGNPPFSRTKVTSDPEYRKQNFMLHDYFFAKTVDRVRPGGLVTFVTSKGTMDKGSNRARQYIADRANLVGAIRLPQTAFKQNAGTEVVTDVLFFQKRGPGIEDNGVQWLGTTEVDTPQGPATINEYFANHPEMVLGNHAKTGSMYRSDEYTVEPRKGEDIEQAFAKATRNLPEDIYRPDLGTQAQEAQAIERDFNPDHKKEGGVYVGDDGALRIIENGSGVALTQRMTASGKATPITAKQQEWLKSYVGVRDALKQAQKDQLVDGDWETSLAALNTAYDAFRKKHGPILAHTVSERENADGTVSVTRRFKNNAMLNLDVESPLIYAIEEIKEDGSIVKAPSLLGRTLEKPKRAEIKTTQDALFVSLNQSGRLDVDDVARLAGIDSEAVIDELGDLIYNDPAKGWSMADEYLSGDVVAKLKEARQAAKVNKALERNVRALEAVQPEPLAPRDITVQLGSHWVPASDVQNFAGEILNERIDVQYSKPTATWQASGGRRGPGEWSTGERSAGELLDAVLNNRQIRITWRDSEGKTHLNAEATEKANDTAKKMREAFKRWIWTDSKRTDRLTKYYNEHFNNIVPREFDGSHLTLPGTSLKFDLYPHQKRAVWRMVQEGNTYMAHSVGAGKTFSMIAGGMEERRLGLTRKPVYVVPNHMLAQFSKEFLELYPTANIMVADEQNFHTKNRQRFVAQAALNDPDAVIMTHSSFERVGMSDEYQADFIQRQIDDMREVLEETDKDDRLTRKQLEQRIEQMESRLKAKTEGKKRDQAITFEEMGIDRVIVDEAHEFRKLDFATSRSNIKGIDPQGSQKAMDLFMKTQYVESKNPNRSLVMASGTPVTNTMGELYTIQRFFQQRQLEEDGLERFDAWSNHFGEVVDGFEQNAAGGYAIVSRFAKFVNVADLMSRVRSFMDVLTSEQLGDLVNRPEAKGGSRQIQVTPTPDGYKEYQAQLAERINAIKNRSGPPKPGDDIILNVIADGRFSAIDMRFVDPTLPSDPNSKLNVMVDKLADAYKETADWEYRSGSEVDTNKGSTLMVFTDLGLGEAAARNRGFDMKAAIRERLIEQGVKADDIAFMRDHKQHAKKERLFADLREGKKRILIGGKDMETGVNVQKRLSHLFHLDAPWFPASVEQREGRAIRQGNQNSEVDARAFATKGSYDSAMWGMIGRKARFIEQAMSGDASMRSMEDVSEASSFEMASALASGDERYLRLAGLKNDVERLNRLYASHNREQKQLRSENVTLDARIEKAQATEAALKAALKQRRVIEAGAFEGKLGNQTFDARDAYSEALFTTFKERAEAYTEGTEVIGQVGGFDVTYNGMTLRGSGDFSASLEMDIPGDGEPLAVFPIDPNMSVKGIATRAVNQVNRLDRDLSDTQQRLEEAQRRQERVQGRIGAEFAEIQEFSEKSQELSDLENELASESKELSDAQDNAAENGEQTSTVADPNRQGASLNIGELDQRLRQGPMGDLLGKLVDNGNMVLHNTARSALRNSPKGTAAYVDSDGRIHVVGENVTADTLMPAVMHEMFHSTVRPLIGGPQWTRLQSRLERLYHQYDRSNGRAKAFLDRARDRVAYAQAQGDTMSRARQVEEFGAYAVEEYASAPRTLQQWVDNAVGTVKAWLQRRFGVQVGDVTPAQLRALTLAAMRNGDMQASPSMDGATAFNVQPENRDAPTTDELTPAQRAQAKRKVLADAEKALDQPPTDEWAGDVVGDMSRAAKFLVHPRQVAALHPTFTPVYRTAIDQFEMRDRIVEELAAGYQPYTLLNKDARGRVDKVLELGRLTNRSFGPADLDKGITNPGYKTVVTYDDNGDIVRRREPLSAQLSSEGEVITLTDDEQAAYQSLRAMFDMALDKFRDQTLEDYGMSEFVGLERPSDAIMDSIDDSMPKATIDKLTRIAAFIQEIEQAKRTGYVPFSRYGDYVVAVKEDRANITIVKNPNGGWIAKDVPDAMDSFMEDIGAQWDGAEQGWQLDANQRAAVRNENSRTVYSTKVETGLNDMLPEWRAKRGAKVDQLPTVKKAMEAARQEWVGDNSNRRIVAFPTIQARSGQGVKLSDVDALAEISGIDNETWDAVRDKLADAIQGQGFRRHFFQSENVPGYSTDFERVISDYIGGMAGYLSRRHHQKQWEDSISGIRAPRLHDYANNYRDYANNPQEEFAMLRQIGFFSYIAGNVATAVVNLTQVPVLTVPALSQVARKGDAIREVKRAYGDAAKMFRLNRETGLDVFDPEAAPADVKTELLEAWAEGAFVPRETYEIMANAQVKSAGGRQMRRKFEDLVKATAYLFTAAERANRLVTFIAAARLAKQGYVQNNSRRVLKDNALATADLLEGEWSPKKFAEFMIDETQFRMGKANRPMISRGVGAPIMQFKSFMMQALESWYRMGTLHGPEGKRAALGSLAAMVAIGGIWGFPGGEDLRDIVEQVYRKITKRDLDLKTELRQWIYEQSGQRWLGEMVTKGITYPTGLDMSRVGMGQIAPDTPMDVFGIPADMFIGRPSRAFEQASNESYLGAASEFLPNFVKNPLQAYSWSQSGVRDGQGRRLLLPEEVPPNAIAKKMFGFQPAIVTDLRDYNYAQWRQETGQDQLKRYYLDRMARAIAEQMRTDDPKVAEQKDEEIIKLFGEVAEHNSQAESEAELIQISDRALENRVEREIGGFKTTFGQERTQARGAAERLRDTFGLEEKLLEENE